VSGVNLSIEAGARARRERTSDRTAPAKSTTVKPLSGILVPTSGDVRVAGGVPHRNRVANAPKHRRPLWTAYAPWWDLPVRESLSLPRDLYEMSTAEYRDRRTHLDEVLDLGEPAPGRGPQAVAVVPHLDHR
jgi:ABC-2 type transport system ATP-binding protein